MNRKLFEFYVSQSRPQYEVWSLKKISVVCECEAESMNDEFLNRKFEALRGSDNQDCAFYFANLPQLNPYNWFIYSF